MVGTTTLAARTSKALVAGALWAMLGLPRGPSVPAFALLWAGGALGLWLVAPVLAVERPQRAPALWALVAAALMFPLSWVTWSATHHRGLLALTLSLVALAPILGFWLLQRRLGWLSGMHPAWTSAAGIALFLPGVLCLAPGRWLEVTTGCVLALAVGRCWPMERLLHRLGGVAAAAWLGTVGALAIAGAPGGVSVVLDEASRAAPVVLGLLGVF